MTDATETEYPQQTIERIGRDALRIYSDLTAQGDSRISTVKNTTTYLAGKLAQLAFDMHELAAVIGATQAVSAPVADEMARRDQLRAMSERMREEAAERFSDRLYYMEKVGRWCEMASGRPVVFTPNGWRLKTDVYGTPDYDLYVQ